VSTDTGIADRVEIADLFAHLANLLDEHRYDDAVRVYHPDLVVRSPRGGEIHGLDEAIAYMKRSRVEGVASQHVHGDVLVEVDGDSAKATANQLVYFWREGEPPHENSGLRTSATVVRTAEGWRFKEVAIALAWQIKA